MTDNPNFC